MHGLVRALVLAFAGVSAVRADAVSSPGVDPGGAPRYSKAETLMWQTDHLANIRRPVKLRYRYTRSGTEEERYTDVIELEVLNFHPDGGKGTRVHFFTGKHEKYVPDQDPVTGNPVLGVFLQAEVYEMQRRTKGGWRYFHRAIKTALSATDALEPVDIDFRGQRVAATRVRITPYAGDARRFPLAAYAAKTYTFTFAEAVPGQLYEIRSVVAKTGAASPDPAPLVEEVLTYVEAGG